MKKGLLYYCLAVSLVLHLLFVLLVRLEQAKNREKEPIAIDLIGPLKWGPKTMLPQPPKASQPPPRIARSFPMRPSFPSIPVPARPMPRPQPEPPAKSPGTHPVPGEIKTPQPPGGPTAAQTPPVRQQPSGASSPAKPQGSAEAGVEPTPRKLIKPTEEDLMRYAKVDRESEKSRDNETVTLDTQDLIYTSYLQGIKRRIELIWKYPETARQDGLQGNLVIKFSIGKSGKIEDIELVKSSGYQILDDAARQALMDATPFNPLPENWKKDYFTITGTFVYRIYGMYLR